MAKAADIEGFPAFQGYASNFMVAITRGAGLLLARVAVQTNKSDCFLLK